MLSGAYLQENAMWRRHEQAWHSSEEEESDDEAWTDGEEYDRHGYKKRVRKGARSLYNIALLGTLSHLGSREAASSCSGLIKLAKPVRVAFRLPEAAEFSPAGLQVPGEPGLLL